MDTLTIDDLKRVVKFLSVPISMDRIQIILSPLRHNLDLIRPLAQNNPSKDIEPTSYLRLMAKKAEDSH
jgi:pantothenate kinase